MKIGILGGTFDPPHYGHLVLADSALASGHVQRVLMIPAGIPPHKHRPDISCAPHRLAMTSILASSHSRVEMEPMEIMREGTSYTVDTLIALRQKWPSDTFRLIIGADMAIEFHTWKRAEEAIEMAPPLVAERPGARLPADLIHDGPADMSPAMRRVLQAGRIPMPRQEISSSAIRDVVRAGGDITDMTLPFIQEYIRRHGLYGSSL